MAASFWLGNAQFFAGSDEQLVVPDRRSRKARAPAELASFASREPWRLEPSDARSYWVFVPEVRWQ